MDKPISDNDLVHPRIPQRSLSQLRAKAIFIIASEPLSVIRMVSDVLVCPGHGERQISEDDLRHVDLIIEQDDNPERLIDWFGERRLEYSSLQDVVTKQPVQTFQIFL
jgi:hypothetical protein